MQEIPKASSARQRELARLRAHEAKARVPDPGPMRVVRRSEVSDHDRRHEATAAAVPSSTDATDDVAKNDRRPVAETDPVESTMRFEGTVDDGSAEWAETEEYPSSTTNEAQVPEVEFGATETDGQDYTETEAEEEEEVKTQPPGYPVREAPAADETQAPWRETEESRVDPLDLPHEVGGVQEFAEAVPLRELSREQLDIVVKSVFDRAYGEDWQVRLVNSPQSQQELHNQVAEQLREERRNEFAYDVAGGALLIRAAAKTDADEASERTSLAAALLVEALWKVLDFVVGAPVSLVLNPPSDFAQAIFYATSLAGR